MKKYLLLLTLGIGVSIGCSSSDSDSAPIVPPVVPETLNPVPVTKTNDMKIYMHYMPWFETKESSPDNQWGYHWKMGNRNPDNIDGNGRRDIASHFYPLIGPYHSGDKAVIENHLLLMKYAGVDGLLIDWYGTFDHNDYRVNKENSEQLIAMLDKVGLSYAIVYEDRFLPDIVSAGLAPSVTAAARTDCNYMQSNYFGDTNYIKVNGKPLLLNFGPVTLNAPAQWTTAFSSLDPKPAFLTLWHESGEAGSNASGEFAWVYQDNAHLADFYTNHFPNLPLAFASAYPGFDDFYQEGGGGAAIGWTIAHNNGATLDATLAMAQNANADYLQLITWNDFGEGTMLEPTVEFGYSSVEKIKTFAGVQNTGNVFGEIGRLYNLRIQYKNNAAVQAKLDKAFGYFVSMQPDKAVPILNEIP